METTGLLNLKHRTHDATVTILEAIVTWEPSQVCEQQVWYDQMGTKLQEFCVDDMDYVEVAEQVQKRVQENWVRDVQNDAALFYDGVHEHGDDQMEKKLYN